MTTLLPAIATGMGLLTDKYMLGATNFVEHYAVEFHASDDQKAFVKSAMYGGAVLGMMIFGPLSDITGRRAGLMMCSVVTLIGALLSTFAWSANILIIARIITGIGMGGEYPLASSHSAESSTSTGDGARNVALLYLFGSGGGQALCPLVVYFLDLTMDPANNPPNGELLWRILFGIGAAMSLLGLVLRYFTVKDSEKFKAAKTAAKSKGSSWGIVAVYWKPLLGTSLAWLLFDVVEYGLKQNDAAIFDAGKDAPYRNVALTVFLTRLLVIPSLILAPILLRRFPSKPVQMVGFAGCALINIILACFFHTLHDNYVPIFDAIYIIQLSFQSFPGVTTMAIPAEIFPSSIRGTGAGISAASGKVGAMIGSYVFSVMKDAGSLSEIFWTVVGTSAAAFLLTLCVFPRYNGLTLDLADDLSREDKHKEALAMLYSGPQEESDDDATENETGGSEEESE